MFSVSIAAGMNDCAIARTDRHSTQDGPGLAVQTAIRPRNAADHLIAASSTTSQLAADAVLLPTWAIPRRWLHFAAPTGLAV